MFENNKYETNELEGFEPDSEGRVLKNKLNIKNPDEMEDLESLAYERCIEASIEQFSATDVLTVSDILWMHDEWLGRIYSFAGKYRTVNMSKPGVFFAAAHLIQGLMADFEKNILLTYTPGSKWVSLDDLVHALAVVHVEFILIHPFREGNGRLGRLISTLMALQSGQSMVDFDYISHAKGREEYFKAIQAGFDKDYSLMESLFRRMINVQDDKD